MVIEEGWLGNRGGLAPKNLIDSTLLLKSPKWCVLNMDSSRSPHYTEVAVVQFAQVKLVHINVLVIVRSRVWRMYSTLKLYNPYIPNRRGLTILCHTAGLTSKEEQSTAGAEHEQHNWSRAQHTAGGAEHSTQQEE